MFTKITEKWQDILDFMREEFEVDNIPYNTWLVPLVPYALVENRLFIIAHEDNPIVVKIVTGKYKDLLPVAIEMTTGCKVEPVFITNADKDNISRRQSETHTPAPAREDDFSEFLKKKGLNPNYTFNTFVSGKSNELAHAASLAVAESPGQEYKLLYIYGGAGLGKTHLMHAIAIYILKNNPDARIIYTTSENFMNEFINSLKDKNSDAFRNKYRNLDVLLIDDIQFIVGRDNTQEEFFNTFNVLYGNDKQIIISSDKPPREINNLEDRIKSRFEGGMMVDIQPPNFETRMAILRKKEEVSGYRIDDEVIKYIATNIKSNVRTLEGALSRIVLKSKLEKVPINVETAAFILRDVIDGSSGSADNKITPQKILSVVTEHFQISEEDMTAEKKAKDYAYPRQLIMYLSCTMTDCTLKEIGNIINRDHATISHGRDKIAEEMKFNDRIKKDVEILKKKISN